MKHRHVITTTALILTASLAIAAPPVTYYEYDANGNGTKVTDGLMHATTEQYDRLDRPVQTHQPHPSSTGQLGIIGTQYNALDQVTGVTDPRNLSTTYTKNAFGDILSMASPDTGTTSFTYDNAGRVLTRTDARGAVTNYAYDSGDRITDVSYKPSTSAAADESATFWYEQTGYYNMGKLGRINDASGITHFYHDEHGKLNFKRQATNGKVFDHYLPRDYRTGRLVGYGYPSQHLINYEHNANGQITSIYILGGPVLLNNVFYHPNGSPAGWQWGNGEHYFRFMDEYARINGYTVGDKSQLLTYDNAGRIIQTYRTLDGTTPIANTTVNYTYDNIDRITGNNTNSTTHGYYYDLTGNRTQLTIGGNSYPYTIASNSNRLNGESGPTARTNTYDAAGNLTSNGQDTYSYYASGRLKQVTRNGANIYHVKYNAMGEMVHRTNSNTYYTYDEDHHLIGEYDSNGKAIQETVYLGDIPVVTIRSNSTTLQDNIYYIYSDHLNTPREIRNHSNQIRWTWYPETSEAFGANPPNDNPAGLGTFTYNLRFPGQLYDPVTQLSYNYYRDYNPRTGRYIQSDPIGLEGGINTYAYVESDPLRFVDPEGLCTRLPCFWDGIGLLPRGGASARVKVDSIAPTRVESISKSCNSEKIYTDPRNLIPTERTSSSVVKRLSKDMKKNGFNENYPITATRNSNNRLEIENGHHRRDAAIKAGVDKVPVEIFK